MMMRYVVSLSDIIDVMWDDVMYDDHHVMWDDGMYDDA